MELGRMISEFICNQPGLVTTYGGISQVLVQAHKTGVVLDNDAVCYVLAKHVLGGKIGELSKGCWINIVPNGEDVSFHDYCRAAKRAGTAVGNVRAVFTPKEFLDNDKSGTLEERTRILEILLIKLLSILPEP